MVWIANFVGSLLLVYIVAGGFYGVGPDGAMATGLFKGAVGAKALAVAKGKLELTWSAAFFRAILCNWLVCMAVWLALASKDVVGKVFGIFFPIMAFVASGFEHSVANMFFIPMGLVVAQIPAIVDVAAAAAGATTPEAVAAFKLQSPSVHLEDLHYEQPDPGDPGTTSWADPSWWVHCTGTPTEKRRSGGKRQNNRGLNPLLLRNHPGGVFSPPFSYYGQ